MRRSSHTDPHVSTGGYALGPLVVLVFLAIVLARATPAEAAQEPALCDGLPVTIAGTAGT